MEKEKKNFLLTFIELGVKSGLLKDKVKEHENELNKIIRKIEDNWTGDKKLFLQLENTINDVIELTQHQYYEFGKIANVIEEEYRPDYDPFERVAS